MRPLCSQRSSDHGHVLYAVALTIMTAATPLLLAAVGEVVVERSGVLNLGVEGMMIMGAVCGFGAAFYTGSAAVGLIAAIAAGVLMALLFGFLTLTLVSNQVATGLALTLLGIGLSGLIGEGFVGQPGVKLWSIAGIDPFIPLLFGAIYLSTARGHFLCLVSHQDGPHHPRRGRQPCLGAFARL